MNEEINLNDFKEQPKKRLHPIVSFLILTGILIIASGILSLFDLSVTFDKVNSSTMVIEKTVISVESLFRFKGLRYILSNAVINFVSFAPLGMILISLLGVSVAEKSGYLRAAFTKIANKLNHQTITFIVILLGILSSLFVEVGYVILLPIAALLFLIQNRNPLTGMAAAFAGISIGYALNFFAVPLDGTLAGYTELASKLIDKNYLVSGNSNLIFMFPATIIFAFLATYITEHIICKKTGIYQGKNNFTKIEITKKEQKGLALARYIVIFLTVSIIYMIIPGLPGSGILLDNSEASYINQLFGNNAAFSEGLTFIIAIILMLGGIGYGIATRKIRNDKDVANLLTNSLDGAGHYIVLIFFASQFIALFKYTNIGTIIVAVVTNFISALPFQGITLLIFCFLAIAFLNLFVPSTTTKWAIVAPVFVPLLMQYNIAPEFTQLIYRLGESMTNGITPMQVYFVIFLALAHKYTQDDETNNIRHAISLITPYAFWFGISMLAMILIWYFFKIPLMIDVMPLL